MTTTSPLVSAYLADLDRALAGADPGDRAEIVDAVREHIDAAVAELGAAPSQAEIAGVLRRLGSADAVAAAWAASERPTSPTAAAPATTAAPSGAPMLAYGVPAGAPYGAAPYGASTPCPDAGDGRDQAAPPYARPPGGTAGSVPAKLPTWATVLLIAIGVVVLGPLVIFIPAALALVPIRGGAPGWVVIAAVAVLIVGSVACLFAARRSERHRGAWLASGIVGLVLAVPLAIAAFGFASFGGGSSSEGPAAPVVEVIPTPRPAAGG